MPVSVLSTVDWCVPRNLEHSSNLRQQAAVTLPPCLIKGEGDASPVLSCSASWVWPTQRSKEKPEVDCDAGQCGREHRGGRRSSSSHRTGSKILITQILTAESKYPHGYCQLLELLTSLPPWLRCTWETHIFWHYLPSIVFIEAEHDQHLIVSMLGSVSANPFLY